jgi:Domain of unknown function (DUF4263)
MGCYIGSVRVCPELWLLPSQGAIMGEHQNSQQTRVPWNKGKLIGQKAPLKLKEIWAIRIRLQLARRARDLALFNLGIDSKLRGCDLVGLRVCDVAQGGRVASRTIVMQRKTHRPVQFELTEQTREAVHAWHWRSARPPRPSRRASSRSTCMMEYRKRNAYAPMESRYSYEIVSPPDTAMEWRTYEAIINREWVALLEQTPPASERDMHVFFERHPCMVPGAFNILGNESGHAPHFAALISEPPLPSYHKRVPDFMWVSSNSEADQPVLIEIEQPGKAWFTRKGQPTADLTQALDQIAEWKAWFNVPHNTQAFKAFYGLEQSSWMRRDFQPAYVLIYGRRAEANRDPGLTAKRAHLRAEDIVAMTYDRLAPNRSADEYPCVKATAACQFAAVSVPPTIAWGPRHAERALFAHLERAIERNPYLSRVRKDFLMSRLPYWREWVLSKERGFCNLTDSE